MFTGCFFETNAGLQGFTAELLEVAALAESNSFDAKSMEDHWGELGVLLICIWVVSV